jgi:hypothetical protein
MFFHERDLSYVTTKRASKRDVESVAAQFADGQYRFRR